MKNLVDSKFIIYNLIIIIFLFLISISIVSGASSKSDISLSLNWNSDEIVNGNEFSIEIEAFDLEEKDYDIKIYIYNEDKNKPISQTYSEADSKWVASTTYLKSFFISGEDNGKVKMRIKNSVDFSGEAKIGARIRETGGRNYIAEKEDMINILKADNINNISGEDKKTTKKTLVSAGKIMEEYSEQIISKDTIYLNNAEAESIKSKKNILYQSKNELIKIYSIMGFIILIVVFFVMFSFLKRYYGK